MRAIFWPSVRLAGEEDARSGRASRARSCFTVAFLSVHSLLSRTRVSRDGDEVVSIVEPEARGFGADRLAARAPPDGREVESVFRQRADPSDVDGRRTVDLHSELARINLDEGGHASPACLERARP